MRGVDERESLMVSDGSFGHNSMLSPSVSYRYDMNGGDNDRGGSSHSDRGTGLRIRSDQTSGFNGLNSVRRRVMGQGTNIGGATINDIVPSGGSRNKLGLDELFPPLPSTTLWPINRPVSSSVPSPSTLSTMDSVTTARTVYSVAVNNPDLASEPNYTLSAPEDVLELPHGITYRQSVTMVAQLYPAVKAEPSNVIWGLPTVFWGVIIGCTVLAVLSLATIFLCCWLIPRSRKFLSPTRFSSTRTQVTDGPRISVHSVESVERELDLQRETAAPEEPKREIIMAHSTSKNGNSNNGHMPSVGGVGGGVGHTHHAAALMYQSPPQYNPPPVPPKANSGTNSFVTAQQVAQQQQYYHMQSQYQKQQQQQNYCSQVMQQQNYHNYYRVNPHPQQPTGNGAYQSCSKHSGSSSSNDNSPKVSNNNNNNNTTNNQFQNNKTNNNHINNGNNRQHHPQHHHSHGAGENKRPSCLKNSGVNVATATTPMNIMNSAPEAHKSMWAINNLHSSNTGLSDMELAAYRTRSLPSWGKGNKQRPVSTADDLEELYAKVNFSKKRKNRMRNDEAAIIALCRSKSQNLSGVPLDRDGIVVYDERTAL